MHADPAPRNGQTPGLLFRLESVDAGGRGYARAAPAAAVDGPTAMHVPWRPLVLLCRQHRPGWWKVFGRIDDAARAADPDAHTLAESDSLAVLREALRLRGYRLREGWIDEARGTGLEIHERPEAAVTPVAAAAAEVRP